MKLTILMYHKIDELASDVRTPGNFVGPALFTQQLDALDAWGYRTIDFADWLAYRDGGRISRSGRVDSHARRRLHVLRRPLRGLRAPARDMGAWVFLVASQIGGTNCDRAERSFPGSRP
jgi:hypothetical protein